MALLAGYQLLLARCSGQDDVVVGSPVAGRRAVELEELIGFFANTLVLRTRLNGGPSFRELLARVRESVLGAFAHQDIPFERLVEVLQPSRDQSRAPLFQALFALARVPLPQAVGGDLSLVPFQTGAITSKFDLELGLEESAEGFSGVLIYNTELFRAETAANLARCYLTLLEGLVAQPERPVHTLPLLGADALHQVLVEWNTSRDAPPEATLHQLFEAQVARAPDAPAVSSAEVTLSYRELDERANQLAHLLRQEGAGPEVRVALCLSRSLDFIVGVLGILKSGAAYVPLEPTYPAERLALMLSDSNAPLLLTHQELAPRLPTQGRRVLLLDADWPRAEALPRQAPRAGATPDNLAYILYTSGSTGVPKGTCVEHRAVARNFVQARYADFGPEHSVLLAAPISFDVSALEMWGALATGGRLVVFPQPPNDMRELAQALDTQRVTTLILTSSLFTQLMEAGPLNLRGPRQVLTGGDVISPPHVRRAVEAGVSVTACYGPTEGAINTTCHRMTEPSHVPATIPLGTPIAGTRVYVLDRNLVPVPPGIPGELYIAGGLARGYLGQPALTAERFLPDPFSPLPGARMYRTGDLARWTPGGGLEFAGRADLQVKVRGFRIELGEVEAALLAHPEVRQAVAVAREDTPGDRRLVAYVVAAPSLDASTLRTFLQGRLPHFMVPTALVTLAALPLTPNGKVDRKALPRPEAPTSRQHVAPRDEVEQELATLWAEVLGVERVGVTDNFFDLGGYSLLATRLLARIRAAFQAEVSLRDFFENPTVEHTAVLVAQSLAEQLGDAELEEMMTSLDPAASGPGGSN
jgi:amino acid adenylation domain-containing protein